MTGFDLDDFLWTYQGLIVALGVNGLLALSMYVVLAIGQLSLGQAAFMGIGAYASALLSLHSGLPFPLVLAAAMLAPALVALAIGAPTLRLSGVYLALATIGLGEILRIFLIQSDFAGGALGLSGIPAKAGLTLIYGSLAAATLALMLVCRSRIGRAMEAIREDEVAASLSGVNLPRYRMAALVASAMLAGLAGALNAHASTSISPNEYGFDAAVTILSFALLGGVRSPLGPVAGALVLTLLPEVLRPLHDYRLVVNGLIIVIAVLYMPHGILPWRVSRIGVADEGAGMSAPRCIEGLTLRYGGLTAIDSLDLRVAAGSLHGLIGPNGAGKTSVFNAICGLARGSGAIRLAGEAIVIFRPTRGRGAGSRAPSRTSGCSTK